MRQIDLTCAVIRSSWTCTSVNYVEFKISLSTSARIYSAFSRIYRTYRPKTNKSADFGAAKVSTKRKCQELVVLGVIDLVRDPDLVDSCRHHLSDVPRSSVISALAASIGFRHVETVD